MQNGENEAKEYENYLVTNQGVDPAMAAQMAQAAMLGREFDIADDTIQEHRENPYTVSSGGKYGVTLGNPLGALYGGYQAGKAMNERRELVEQGKEAAQAYADQLMGQRTPAAPSVGDKVSALRGSGVGESTSGIGGWAGKFLGGLMR